VAEDQPIARVPAGIEDMIPGYMENRRKEEVELRRLLEAQGFERIGEIAHRMIGVGSPYGFDHITNVARAIRESAAAKDADALARLLDDLANYLRTVKITVE